METVLQITLPVFGLVFCGYLGSKLRLLPAEAVNGINAFVFWFALPAMLFRVVGLRPLTELFEPRFIAGYLIAGLAIFMLAFSGSRGAALTGQPESAAQSTGFALTAAHGNVGYMGLALVAELSRDALPLATLTVICDIFVLIAMSTAMLELQTHRGARPAAIMVKVLLGLGRSPLVVSLVVGLLFALSGRTLFPVADHFTRMLANAAGPCALFAIGASLGSQKLRIDRPILLLSAIKLLIHPLLAALLLLVVFQLPREVGAIGVLCAALPPASNAFIIAQRYQLDTADIASSILVATFVALGTVSLTIWSLGLVGH